MWKLFRSSRRRRAGLLRLPSNPQNQPVQKVWPHLCVYIPYSVLLVLCIFKFKLNNLPFAKVACDVSVRIGFLILIRKKFIFDLIIYMNVYNLCVFLPPTVWSCFCLYVYSLRTKPFRKVWIKWLFVWIIPNLGFCTG